MYKFLTALICLLFIIASSFADAPRPKFKRGLLGKYRFGNSQQSVGDTKTSKWTWTTTVTTNDLEQVTKVSTGVSTNGQTKTVCFVWNDNVVPFKYREVFLNLSEEEKSMALSGKTDLWTENTPVAPMYPKEVIKSSSDDNLTKEIREIQLRW